MFSISMTTPEDTYNALRRTPLDPMWDLWIDWCALHPQDGDSAEFLASHGWTWVELRHAALDIQE